VSQHSAFICDPKGLVVLRAEWQEGSLAVTVNRSPEESIKLLEELLAKLKPVSNEPLGGTVLKSDVLWLTEVEPFVAEMNAIASKWIGQKQDVYVSDHAFKAASTAQTLLCMIARALQEAQKNTIEIKILPAHLTPS
jgi:hypothetical protein